MADQGRVGGLETVSFGVENDLKTVCRKRISIVLLVLGKNMDTEIAIIPCVEYQA